VRLGVATVDLMRRRRDAPNGLMEERFLVYQRGPLTCLRTVLALGRITRR
jgi:hypothetical protein